MWSPVCANEKGQVPVAELRSRKAWRGTQKEVATERMCGLPAGDAVLPGTVSDQVGLAACGERGDNG